MRKYTRTHTMMFAEFLLAVLSATTAAVMLLLAISWVVGVLEAAIKAA